MRILVINTIWPYPSHSIRAANVVFFELLSEFCKQPGAKPLFLKIDESEDSVITKDEKEGIDLLTAQGVKILPPLVLLTPFIKRGVLKRIISPEITDFYPQLIHKKKVEEIIISYKPDVLFIPWSNYATPLCSDIPVVKFAYYGNPDAKSAQAMAKFNFDHGCEKYIKYSVQKRILKSFEKKHLAMIKKYELLGDVAVNDAQYYRKRGHQNAFYMQNVWIDRFGDSWIEKKKMAENDKTIIVGNIGKLGGTANTHGLELLGRDLLPAFRQAMKGREFEIHIFGSGNLHPAISKYFQAPEIRMRGFVDDIDQEILSAKVFLCMNNGSAYKVGHTRYLHAWSLGCCIVAHKDAALSMPEMVHGENVLLGGTSAEIAELIKTAIENTSLRAKIGQGGYNTFKGYFTAEKVVPKILRKIQEYKPH